MSLLNIRNLSLSIHGAPILKDISLSIGEGEIAALTGESGSGKSMTAFRNNRLVAERRKD